MATVKGESTKGGSTLDKPIVKNVCAETADLKGGGKK